jgi:hypothetical protein
MRVMQCLKRSVGFKEVEVDMGDRMFCRTDVLEVRLLTTRPFIGPGCLNATGPLHLQSSGKQSSVNHELVPAQEKLAMSCRHNVYC